MNFMQIWYESNNFSPCFFFSYQIWKKSISFLPYYCLWKYSGFNMKKKITVHYSINYRKPIMNLDPIFVNSTWCNMIFRNSYCYKKIHVTLKIVKKKWFLFNMDVIVNLYSWLSLSSNFSSQSNKGNWYQFSVLTFSSYQTPYDVNLVSFLYSTLSSFLHFSSFNFSFYFLTSK